MTNMLDQHVWLYRAANCSTSTRENKMKNETFNHYDLPAMTSAEGIERARVYSRGQVEQMREWAELSAKNMRRDNGPGDAAGDKARFAALAGALNMILKTIDGKAAA
jgi:hypothetical protein